MPRENTNAVAMPACVSVAAQRAWRMAIMSAGDDSPIESIKELAEQGFKEVLRETKTKDKSLKDLLTKLSEKETFEGMAIELGVTAITEVYDAISTEWDTAQKKRDKLRQDFQKKVAKFAVPENRDEGKISKYQLFMRDFINLASDPETPWLKRYLGMRKQPQETESGKIIHYILPYYRMTERIAQPTTDPSSTEAVKASIERFSSAAFDDATTKQYQRFKEGDGFFQSMMSPFVSMWQGGDYLNDERVPLYVRMSLRNLLWSLQEAYDLGGRRLMLEECVKRCSKVEKFLDKVLSKSPPFLDQVSDDDNRLEWFVRSTKNYVTQLKKAYMTQQLTQLRFTELIEGGYYSLRESAKGLMKLLYQCDDTATNRKVPDENAAGLLVTTVEQLNLLIGKNSDVLGPFYIYGRNLQSQIPYLNQPISTVIDMFLVFCHLPFFERGAIIDKLRNSPQKTSNHAAILLQDLDQYFIQPIEAGHPIKDKVAMNCAARNFICSSSDTRLQARAQITGQRIVPILALVLESLQAIVDTPKSYDIARASQNSTSALTWNEEIDEKNMSSPLNTKRASLKGIASPHAVTRLAIKIPSTGSGADDSGSITSSLAPASDKTTTSSMQVTPEKGDSSGEVHIDCVPILSGRQQIQAINELAYQTTQLVLDDTSGFKLPAPGEPRDKKSYFCYEVEAFIASQQKEKTSKNKPAPKIEYNRLPLEQYRFVQVTTLLKAVDNLLSSYRSFLQNKAFHAFLKRCLDKIKSEYQKFNEHISNAENRIDHNEENEQLKTILLPILDILDESLQDFETSVSRFQRIIDDPAFVEREREHLTDTLKEIDEQYNILFDEPSGLEKMLPPEVVRSQSKKTALLEQKLSVQYGFTTVLSTEQLRFSALMRLSNTCYDALSPASRISRKGRLLRGMIKNLEQEAFVDDLSLKGYLTDLIRLTASPMYNVFGNSEYTKTSSFQALLDAMKDPQYYLVLSFESVLFGHDRFKFSGVTDEVILKAVHELREENHWEEFIVEEALSDVNQFAPDSTPYFYLMVGLAVTGTALLVFAMFLAMPLAIATAVTGSAMALAGMSMFTARLMTEDESDEAARTSYNNWGFDAAY